MVDLRNTKSYWRSRLPHWEIENGIYFVTLRVAGSMPQEVQNRLEEERKTLESIEASSEAFAQYQRMVFRTCEKYLDSGYGNCPFEDEAIAKCMELEILGSCEKDKWHVDQFCIMPNHVHLLVSPIDDAGLSLKDFIKRLKGRSSFSINKLLSRKGRFWQVDWFDRWVRSEAELRRIRDYIRENPKKAGLPEKYSKQPYMS